MTRYFPNTSNTLTGSDIKWPIHFINLKNW
jgi:hypothetical protein